MTALHVAWFAKAMDLGKPAYGTPEQLQWDDFVSKFENRREGDKDGPCVSFARFKLEPDGKHIRRKNNNLLARTAIALDIETNKKTREVPPAIDDVLVNLDRREVAAVVYTSHNYCPSDPRYRLIMPLSAEIPVDLPAPEIVADKLGLLGVLDMSKLGAASVFYLPSHGVGTSLDHHLEVVIQGQPLPAKWIRQHAGNLLAERTAEQERIAAAAQAEAAERRAAKIAAGFDPDDSVIEKIRIGLDLGSILLAHGYDQKGRSFRHPASSSGMFGASIANIGGVDRIFSHNATDPLHVTHLPEWCTVKAVDAVDAMIILAFNGDRKRGLCEMAKKAGIVRERTSPSGSQEGRKAVAKTIFRMIRQRAPQEQIEADAFAQGQQHGLSRGDVIRVATWVANKANENREAV